MSLRRLHSRYRFFLFALLIVWTNVIVVVGKAGPTTITTTPDGSSDHKALRLTLEAERIEHVRGVLTARLEQILNGKRATSFAKWADKQGDLKILSTHGVDEVDLSITNTTSSTTTSTTTTTSAADDKNKKQQNALFPANKLDLDLVPVESLPNLYPGKPQHLIDDRPPNFVELFFRSIKLGFNFAPVTMTTWLAVLSPSFREHIWYRWIASCLAASGPAFIKWGQWASTRSDMFSESLCSALSQLHNDAPSHSWAHTQKMMESSLGLPKQTLLQVFETFDPQPVASGSIAQVHKASLLLVDNKKKTPTTTPTYVAIKVRHPNVSRLIDMDFRIMQFGARLMDLFPALSWLRVRDTVEQFSSTMAAQAHLNVEGHHLEILNYNFRGWPQVQFPRPVYASSSVIIETFEPGRIVTKILDDYDELAAAQQREQDNVPFGEPIVEEVDDDDDEEEIGADDDSNDRGAGSMGHKLIPVPVAKFMITTGLSIYLKMLLVDNLMHADLHPGNIMFDLKWDQQNEGQEPSKSRVLVPVEDHSKKPLAVEKLTFTLVDAGMVAQLTKEESTNFIGFLCTLGEGDGRLAGKFALRFSRDNVKTMSAEEQEAFIADMALMFKERCRGYYHNVSVGNVLRGVLGVIREHRVRVDANYATLVVNALCVESLAERAFPSYNLLDAARPFLQAYKQLCFDSKGEPKDDPSKFRKTIVKMTMPLAYLSKTFGDSAFFGKHKRKIKKEQRKANL